MIYLYTALLSLAMGFSGGFYLEHLRWEKSMKDVIEANYLGIKNNDIIKEKIVTKYLTKVQNVEHQTERIEYVSLKMSGTIMSTGFVELHNAAAEGRDASPPIVADATPAKTGDDSTYATRIIERNYGKYHKAEVIVAGLQEYITTVCK